MPYCQKCGFALSEEAKFCPVCGASVSMEKIQSTSSPLESGVKLAYWWERFIAWLIDSVIIGVLVGILGLFNLLVGQSFTWWTGWPAWMPFFNFNLSGLILFLYWLLMDGTYGQSFGKMVMHIKITRLDGHDISMVNAVLESIGKAFLLPLDCLLGWILYPKRKQRIFNYISETIVVKTT